MFRIRVTKSALALAVVLGVGAAAPWSSAADTIAMDKLPKAARQEIKKETEGSTKIAVYDAGGGSYRAHYTAATGKRMELIVSEEGKVISQGETQSQRRKDQEEALANAKTDAERNQVLAQQAAARDAEDKAAYAALQAQQQAQLAAAHVAPSSPGASASHAGETMQQISEEFNGTGRVAVAATALPPGVKKTLDMETLGTKNIDYYKYTVDNKTFYSAHYDASSNGRTICRVDETGKLLGKNELTGAAEAADMPIGQSPKKATK